MSQELQVQAQTTLETARAFVITNQIELNTVSMFLKDVKTLKKKINDTFDPIIYKCLQSHREALAQKKGFTDPLDQSEKIMKTKISAFLQEEENKRREEQRKLEAIARKQREEEALMRAQKETCEKKQEQIIQQAIEEKVMVHVEPTIEKPKGISTKQVWRFRITDESQIDQKFKIVDEQKIGNLVRSMGKDAEAIVKGIECYEETIIAARI